MKTESHSWLMTGVGEPLVCRDLSPAAPEHNQVTVEVAGCGVCHTDLGYLYDGVRPNHELPLTLGHEISGRVVQAGEEAAHWLGKAVIIPSVIPCGECELCRNGLGNICRSQKMPGNDIHGGFADFVTVPAYGLCEVDEDLLEKSGMKLADVSVVADAVTTPYQAAKLAQISPGDLAVVIGVGGVGGYAVQIARALGATVVAVDVDAGKLDKISKYGAAHAINASEVDAKSLKKEVQAFAKENDLPATQWKIFECSGIAAGQMTAYGLLTYGAHIAIVGFTLDKTQVRLSNLMAYNARMQGNWGCVPEYYPEALGLVLSKKIEMKPFVHQYPLDEINSVMEAVHSHAVNERPILVP